jgi:hypothetical protein
MLTMLVGVKMRKEEVYVIFAPKTTLLTYALDLQKPRSY